MRCSSVLYIENTRSYGENELLGDYEHKRDELQRFVHHWMLLICTFIIHSWYLLFDYTIRGGISKRKYNICDTFFIYLQAK